MDACDPAQGCHCALFWASINQCSLKWTPCNSAMLNLAPNANGAVVVQPCITYPIAVKPQSASAHYPCSCRHVTRCPRLLINSFSLCMLACIQRDVSERRIAAEYVCSRLLWVCVHVQHAFQVHVLVRSQLLLHACTENTEPFLSLEGEIVKLVCCAVGSCGAGQPMRQYPGWMITKAACTEPACTSNTTTAASIDACTSACVTAGYEKCKSVQYIDAEV